MKDNTASIWNLTLAKFRRRASNDRPNPAGAAVGMVTAVLGCSLISMALKISAKKNNTDPDLPSAGRVLQALMERLSNYADADVRLFNKYLAARRAAGRTSTQYAAASTPPVRTFDAAKSATMILLKAADDALSAIRLAESVLDV